MIRITRLSNYKSMPEDTVKHLEFIQNVITRMSGNSFLIKGWMITLVSALFALAAKDADNRYSIITYFIIPAFWLLDSYYLSRERQYRALYDEVRFGCMTRFSMNARKYAKGKNTWLQSFFSVTLLAFYLPVIATSLLIVFWLGGHGLPHFPWPC